MTEPTRERSFLDRFLAVVPVAVAALAVLSLLFWQAASRRTPTIFSDELKWAQLSRAIADTGHAAQRGEPTSFGSLYAFLIAPGWWFSSTGTAYAAIKYLDSVVVALTSVPAYLLARMLVPKRVAVLVALASVCTTAIYYAGFLLPETLAYPVFAICAYVSVKALAGAGRRWIAAAVVLDLAAPLVRQELVVLPASLAIAACVLWAVGPRSRRLRRGWSVFDHAGAGVLVIGGLILLNQLASDHVTEWAVVTQTYQGRMWSLGMQAASALAIGLGLLPVACGLGSLWLPERRSDAAWRAFAAFTASAVVTVWLYTAVKAAYLSTVFATRVEERNMIYLGPLLLVGTAVLLTATRPWLPGLLAAWGFTTWLVVYYGYQLDYPYFEAPGYGIAVLANRDWHWNQPAIRIGLEVAAAITLAVLALIAARRVPLRYRRAVVVLACAATLTWMLAGELTSASGTAAQSRAIAANLPQPFDWIDRATGRSGTTFVGQNISLGDQLGVNLLEFWNRSVRNIWTLDGSAPGPGRTLTPDLDTPAGALSNDPGLQYAVATSGVELVGPVVATRPGLVLRRVDSRNWALTQAVYGVSSDGWITGTSDVRVAHGAYAYFDRSSGAGTVEVDVSRRGFCSPSAPGTNIVVRIGPVALNEQRAPYVRHATQVRRFKLRNCADVKTQVHATPPVAVEVVASPTVRPSDYGVNESRELGAQVGFRFTPDR